MQLTPLHIKGGRALGGEITVQHSKNAALPVIVATLLSREPVTLHGIPRLSDVYTILDLMAHLGTQHKWVGDNSLELHTPEILNTDAPYALVSKMRASFIVMGAILARAGQATVSMPGGCAWGPRPVDQHVKAFRALGVTLTEDGGNFDARREGSLNGHFVFELLTVGGTHNAILAAVLGDGVVVLDNASIDTDVVDMVEFLNSLGADISGAGTNSITVRGVPELRGGSYTVIPDRIEAGTFMMLAAANRCRLRVRNVRPDHLRAVTAKLQEMGVQITEDGNTLIVDATVADLKPVNVTTQSYPGFPTDLQPQMSALLATVPGTSVVQDPVYPDRLTHVAELHRMGANITVSGYTQVIQGAKLHAAPVKAADLRAGAALFIAGLTTEGETVIDGVQYLNRGYERLAERLRGIGANVLQHDLALAMD
ncbi:UDP-N-acetylglucosamine 1-carboxyvinyltransferase [Deinococcus radiopugnans]|uniref:UDP-N-acetylglucosamine 1-carboxyvinyltransferase n=2 Tax=Deinococcus radiopugnans TaxID=57497 RepID=A0A0A7KK46_9DEIO|nr:UDP-N-acetylglucosamine 1-carboxyvinyltransferase [Deinococcus radiopugnans]AIZ44903.1 UDP-N-acetylglucosamine 1-carboxyvinyltransferase [Deinococcus radiopugnans]MBB6016680.1 UDP-N-acetylglucosamine 1-carboxyvinyltransferase [Deinococcus radiopugnans ATCC 19172]TNM70795.1 UDP-N-acetylglucosamine 1-carboxyvinyltransferase [Deinococcus radiopugnans ATCC 19172]